MLCDKRVVQVECINASGMEAFRLTQVVSKSKSFHLSKHALHDVRIDHGNESDWLHQDLGMARQLLLLQRVWTIQH